jgi:hypothetical protein
MIFGFTEPLYSTFHDINLVINLCENLHWLGSNYVEFVLKLSQTGLMILFDRTYWHVSKICLGTHKACHAANILSMNTASEYMHIIQ